MKEECERDIGSAACRAVVVTRNGAREIRRIREKLEEKLRECENDRSQE